MTIVERELTGVTVLALSGQLDLFNAKELREAAEKLQAAGVERLVIDFAEVSYIDSSGVGALLYLYSLARGGSLELRYVNVTGPVAHVIELTKLQHYFPITTDLETALSELLPG